MTSPVAQVCFQAEAARLGRWSSWLLDPSEPASDYDIVAGAAAIIQSNTRTLRPKTGHTQSPFSYKEPADPTQEAYLEQETWANSWSWSFFLGLSGSCPQLEIVSIPSTPRCPGVFYSQCTGFVISKLLRHKMFIPLRGNLTPSLRLTTSTY